MKKNIIITGFMATGKSTVGGILAKKLGMKYIDMDKVIEERHGLSIAEIFKKYGESYFREQENKLARELSLQENKVIATGGGTMIYLENIKYLARNGIIICLWCSPETIKKRIEKEKDKRPLIKNTYDLNNINFLLTKRKKIYESYLLRVDTTNLSVDEVVNKTINMIMEKIYGEK